MIKIGQKDMFLANLAENLVGKLWFTFNLSYKGLFRFTKLIIKSWKIFFIKKDDYHFTIYIPSRYIMMLAM